MNPLNTMFRLFICCIGIWMFVSSCDINSANENGNDSLPTDVSFSSDIQPIFNQSCAGSACHISKFTNGVRLDTYENAINSMGRTYEALVIQPGSADESPLVDKIEPNPEEGSRMPINKESLNEEDIKLIKGWINEGAKDN